jgi:hypothetical protein
MFKKTKAISEYDQPIQDLENPDDGCRCREAEDECGTMKDELKERRKPEEGVRGGQEQVKFGTRAGIFLKTKEMPVYDQPIQDLENPDDGCRCRKAKDECGTMKDELKERRKVRRRSKRQAGGSRSGLEREPECLRKQKRCQYMIAHQAFTVPRPTRWRPVRNSDSRFEISGRRLSPVPDGTRPRETRNFRIANPNKPNRLKFWWVNQVDGFRPKQTQVIYLTCCQSDTTKLGPVFGKNGWS